MSPVHGRNVALVLDRDTGLASPQFHVAFDPSSNTVKDMTTESKWQTKAGFVVQREFYEKSTRKADTPKPPGETAPNTGKKRRRTRSVEPQHNAESQEMSPQPAAANVDDGCQPTPSNES